MQSKTNQRVFISTLKQIEKKLLKGLGVGTEFGEGGGKEAET